MTDKRQKKQNMCSIPCNLCGSMEVETLSLKDRRRNYLRTVICKKCGLIWSDPRPAEEKIREFYSKKYRVEYKGITRPKKKHIHRDAVVAKKRYEFFKDRLKAEDRILDIGAGNGVFVYCLRKLGFRAQGIGPDEHYSRYAREELNVPVRTGFSQEVEEKASFEWVTLFHVLEHMTDPFRELKNIWHILKPNGKLIVEVPNAEDIRQNPMNRYHKAHLYTFNPETLAAIGGRAGFEVLRKEVAPLHGNVTILFQKKPRIPWFSMDLIRNHLKITTLLKTYTAFRHFTTWNSYAKFFQNLSVAVREQFVIRKFDEDKKLIDAVIKKEEKQHS